MIKKLPVNELKKGMYVCGIEKGAPGQVLFFMNNMLIRNDEDIRRFDNNGYMYAYVEDITIASRITDTPKTSPDSSQGSPLEKMTFNEKPFQGPEEVLNDGKKEVFIDSGERPHPFRDTRLEVFDKTAVKEIFMSDWEGRASGISDGAFKGELKESFTDKDQGISLVSSEGLKKEGAVGDYKRSGFHGEDNISFENETFTAEDIKSAEISGEVPDKGIFSDKAAMSSDGLYGVFGEGIKEVLAEKRPFAESGLEKALVEDALSETSGEVLREKASGAQPLKRRLRGDIRPDMRGESFNEGLSEPPPEMMPSVASGAAEARIEEALPETSGEIFKEVSGGATAEKGLSRERRGEAEALIEYTQPDTPSEAFKEATSEPVTEKRAYGAGGVEAPVEKRAERRPGEAVEEGVIMEALTERKPSENNTGAAFIGGRSSGMQGKARAEEIKTFFTLREPEKKDRPPEFIKVDSKDKGPSSNTTFSGFNYTAPGSGTKTPERYVFSSDRSNDVLDSLDTREEPTDLQNMVEFKKELKEAKKIRAEAEFIVRDFMHTVKAGGSIQFEKMHGMVGKMVNSIFKNQDAITSLVRLKTFDEYTFGHSINVCILSLTLGKHIGFTKEELFTLGEGAILHDIGKMMVPEQILKKPGAFTDAEYAEMKRHTLLGAEFIANTKEITDEARHIILQHHEKYDGTGYNKGLKGPDIHKFARIASVADVYDAMSTNRVYQRKMLPEQSLRKMYTMRGKHFEPELVERLIRCLGIYPIGSVVELNTGEIAIVRIPSHIHPLQPLVSMLSDKNKKPLAKPFEVSLKDEVGRWIVTSKDPDSIGSMGLTA